MELPTGQTKHPTLRGTLHGSLHGTLEQEHREIDEVLRSCIGRPPLGDDGRVALKRAVDELRRHIYVEEDLLFPPLRQAGMVGPVLVMLREHAEMWPLLDTLDSRLAACVSEDELRTTCRQLLVLLQHHNPKEEQILYPQVDNVVGPQASLDVHDVLDVGHLPGGWTCHDLRARDRHS